MERIEALRAKNTMKDEAPLSDTKLLAIAIVIAAVLISGSIVFVNSGKFANRGGGAALQLPQAGEKVLSQGGAEREPSAPVEVSGGNLPFLGKEDAKVTIVEFGDFQCPFCKRFFEGTEAQIRKEYVDTGKVKFYWRDFAFLGEESFDAAVAARCANDQGKFWAYHNLLFKNQKGENEGQFNKENLKKWASQLKLDRKKFDKCLDSNAHRQVVDRENEEARRVGVNGTPTVFVNGEAVVGAVPFAEFRKVIEKSLK